jgi:hypothetical protein
VRFTIGRAQRRPGHQRRADTQGRLSGASGGEAVAERDLPWRPTFRKGYVVFHPPGGYHVLIIDVYWRRTPRLAVKLPASPSELGLMSPDPALQESWTAQEREWGWTVGPLDPLPDGRPAIEIAEGWNRGEGSTITVDPDGEGAGPAA